MRSHILFSLIPAALLLWASPALVGKAAQRQAKERLAKKACLAGDPAQGVEILAELYVDTGEITYIFNQGRCFEQNRRYEDAVGRFREYLLKGEDKLSEADKANAQRRIDACESYLPKAAPISPQVQEPIAPPVAQPVPRPQIAPETLPPTVAREARQPDQSAGSGLRISGIVVGALGVAALGAGVLFNLKNNAMATDLEKPDNFNRDRDSTRKIYKTLGWVGYGAGAALLTTGTVMVVLGWRSGHHSQSEIALVPTFDRGSAGALLTGAF